MTEEQKKKQIYATDGQPDHAERTGGRRIFRLDSSAYHTTREKLQPTGDFSRFRAPQPDPDDLIAPSVASSFTSEVSLAQISEGLRARYAVAKNAAARDLPYDLGGHITQTIEIPLIKSDMVQTADTRFGVFVELDDLPPPTQVGMGPYAFPSAPAPPPAPEKPAETPKKKAQTVRLRRRAPRPIWLKRLFPPRLVAFIALAAALFVPLSLIPNVLHVVHLTVDGQPMGTVIVRNLDAEDIILRQTGYSPNSVDSYTLTQRGLNTQLEFWRAAQVTLICDGNEQTFYALNKTVAEALAELGIELEDNDECNLNQKQILPDLDYVLKDQDQLEIYRVSYQESQRTETVSWQEITRPSPLIADGTVRVMNPGGGRDGTAQRTYRDKYVNGEQWDSVIIDEKFMPYPRHEISLLGKPDAVMSTLNGADFSNIKIINNAPAKYQELLPAQRCTAYSTPTPGWYGASGMYLFQGFVAVDPEVIPLGSLLYVTSPNGKFVYGWAIAADVCQAAREGRVTVDCYFETYQESVLFGLHTMNVYIVKQLTQDELVQYMKDADMFTHNIPKKA